MVAVLSCNVKADDAFKAAVIEISNHFSMATEIQINAGDFEILWILLQEFDDAPPMHIEGEVITCSDFV